MGAGNKVTFHVGMTAVSSIDADNDGSTNDWTAALVQTRYTDATNATLFESTSVTNAGVYVSRVSSSSDVQLRMAEGSGNPKAANISVSDTSSTEVKLVEFTLKAEGAAMTFDTLIASTTATGVTDTSTMVQTFYLLRGTTRIAEEAVTAVDGQVLSFTLDTTEEIAQDATLTYSVVAKISAIGAGSGSATAFDNGDTLTASTSAGVTEINAKAVTDGKSVTNRAGSVSTYTQTLYSEGIQVAKVGESFTLTPNDTVANTSGEFKVTLRVTNFGSNDVYIPLNSLASTTAGATGDNTTKGINFYLTNGTTATSTGQAGTLTGSVSRVSGGVEKTNSVLISGGQSADFMLTVSLNPDTSYSGTQQYRVQIGSVGHATTDTATAATIVATTPTSDFRTAYNTIQN